MSTQPTGAAFLRPGPSDAPVPVPNPVRGESHRIESQCVACGQWDDHPKHSVTAPGGGWLDRHFDCCAAAGCPNAGHEDFHEMSCPEQLSASGNAHGAELIAWLISDDGKARARRANERAHAKRTARVAREAADRHDLEAERARANAKHARQVAADAERTLK